MERITGIEPVTSAWEADVLPLNYTRINISINIRYYTNFLYKSQVLKPKKANYFPNSTLYGWTQSLYKDDIRPYKGISTYVTYSRRQRGGGFSLKHSNEYSINELTPCVPRFSRMTFHSHLGYFTHRRKLGFRILFLCASPYLQLSMYLSLF